MDDNELLKQMLVKLDSIDTKIGDLEKHQWTLDPVINQISEQLTKNETDVDNLKENLAEFKSEVKDRLHSLGNHVNAAKNNLEIHLSESRAERKMAYVMVSGIAVFVSGVFSVIVWLMK